MMRYERKFIVEENFKNRISHFLFENKFMREYPTRNINSIYYDSIDFYRFLESEEGFSDRSKLRLRFYDDPNNLHLEQKFKNSEIGLKEIASFKIFNEKSLIKIKVKDCDNKVINIKIPQKIESEIPSLFVSYKRDYFNNREEKIRITIDYKLRFGKIRNGSYVIKSPQNISSDFAVLEAKYDSSIETLSTLENISNNYFLTLSRCSKYCYGINACY